VASNGFFKVEDERGIFNFKATPGPKFKVKGLKHFIKDLLSNILKWKDIQLYSYILQRLKWRYG